MPNIPKPALPVQVVPLEPAADRALKLVERGRKAGLELKVFPVCSPAMGPHEHWDKATNSMRPCEAEKQGKITLVRFTQQATSDPDEIRRLFKRWPRANVGILCGNGLLCVDVDPKNGGDKTWKKLLKRNGEPSPTWRVKTGGGGWHDFYSIEKNKSVGGKPLDTGIDIRCTNGYVVAAGSLHYSGRTYEDVPGRVLGEDIMRLAKLPGWIRQQLANGKARPPPPRGTAGDKSRIPLGAQHNHLLSLACSLRTRGYHPDTIKAAVVAEWESNCTREKYPLADVEALVADVISRYPAGVRDDIREGPLAELNKSFAFVLTTGAVFTDDPEYCPLGPDGKKKPYHLMDPEHFKTAAVNFPPVYDAKGKPSAAAPYWLLWRARREYNSLVFDPSTTEREIRHPGMSIPSRNIFAGYAAPAKRGSVKLWLQYCNYLFGGLPPLHKKYAMQWIAHAIGHPGIKTNTALVLYSKMQGSGKSLFGELAGKILGQAFKEVTHADFDSSYNSWVEGRVLILFNEADQSRKEQREVMTQLKTLLTNQTITIREKFLKSYDIANLARLIITTNQPNALAFEHSDRRFFVVHVPETRIPGSFVNPIKKWLSTPKGLGALRYWAERYDLRGFNPMAYPPETEAKREMRGLNASDLDLLAGQIVRKQIPWKAGFPLPDLFTASAIRSAFGYMFTQQYSQSAWSTALEKAGARHIQTRSHRFIVIYDYKVWRKRKPREMARYFNDYLEKVNKPPAR